MRAEDQLEAICAYLRTSYPHIPLILDAKRGDIGNTSAMYARTFFETMSFDAITVSFGIRNFENLEKGLTEIYRVLKPNGIFVILETSVPTKFPFKQGYTFYTKFILPIIGKLFSKDNNAYGYLSESAANFPFGETLNNILRKISFIECKAMPQTFGVATIYTATKK